ncbi:MAG: cytidylate kinase [Deltaproteobacteria bacterium HGW-Deltaproteobacteria-22]|jgi:cytidylate kinase|nr:MAG: cytidylate kinase [Deltaproteobacteria bacterium HGW-Deltaproteobacteria-22]
MRKEDLIITIDGPAGSGKSTIANQLADQLGGRRLDTGAMYRAFAFEAVSRGIEEHPRELIHLAASFTLSIDADGRMFVGEKDVTDAIRTPDISSWASKISVIPEVRSALVPIQRRLALPGPTVTEGRDQGTVVFPDAPVKFFLTASPEARARRRHEELTAKGTTISFERVLADQIERDARDENRAVAPLKRAADAILVDTTEMTIAQVVDFLMEKINAVID